MNVHANDHGTSLNHVNRENRENRVNGVSFRSFFLKILSHEVARSIGGYSTTPQFRFSEKIFFCFWVFLDWRVSFPGTYIYILWYLCYSVRYS